MSYPFDEKEKDKGKVKKMMGKKIKAVKGGDRSGNKAPSIIKSDALKLMKPTFKHDKFSTLDEFIIVDNKIYRCLNGKPYGNAYYKIKGNKLYNTVFNPEGHDTSAWYRINGKDIQPTAKHPKGSSNQAWFEIKEKET